MGRRSVVSCWLCAALLGSGCGDDTAAGGAAAGGAGSGGDTSGGGQPGTGGEGGATSFTMCQDAFDYIEEITTALACPTPKAAEFKGTCEATLTAKPQCSEQLQTFIDCAIAAPQADWECDGDGQANLAGSTCDTEEAAIQACAQ